MKKKHLIRNATLDGPRLKIEMANGQTITAAIEQFQYVKAKHTKANGDTAEYFSRRVRITKNDVMQVRVDGQWHAFELEDGDTLEISLQGDATFK